tara:strand:- start:5798 stop:7192 length:1395 start_codon:yes stop_codon:yes gene_type:complete
MSDEKANIQQGGLQRVAPLSAEEALSPSTYQLKSIKLYTNKGGKPLNLVPSVTKITVEESIETSGINVTLNISDSISLLEYYKIIGNERIEMVISHIPVTDKEERTVEVKLRISDIHKYSRIKPGLQEYEFVCVSEHVYNDSVKELVRRFSGSYGEEIEKICKRELSIDEDKLEINKGGGLVNGIYTRLNPLQAINWLVRNATDDKTPFFFYETFGGKNKIRLESLKDMIDKDVHESYFYKPMAENVTGISNEDPKAQYKDEKQQILTFSSTLDASKLRGLSDGSYASTTHNLNYANKSYEVIEYNYKRTNKLNENDPIPTLETSYINEKKFGDHIDGKEYFINQNTLQFSKEEPNYHEVNTISLAASTSYLKNLDNQTQEITLAGDLDLSCGSKIELNIYRPQWEGKKDPFDTYFSGNYIVIKITHEFEQQYKMKLTVQKDSYIESVDEIVEIKGEGTEVDNA